MAEPAAHAIARQMLRGCGEASLASLMAGDTDDSITPYASLVLYACCSAGKPLLLLSDLAQHSLNIARDAAVSMLVRDFDKKENIQDPLASARLTIQGSIHRHDSTMDRERYIRRHPSAGFYAGFNDFHLYRMEVERAHLVAGFGVITWLEAATFMPPATPALAAAEAEIIDHMNTDHADAVQLYAASLDRFPAAGKTLAGDSGEHCWQMTGIDGDGIDLRKGGRYLRYGFDTPINTAGDARRKLAAAARDIRTVRPPRVPS